MEFQNDAALKCGQYIHIQSFKHDGSLHRTWTMGMVIHAASDGYTIVTNKSWVIESDGRTWLTREPALWFFYPDQWFNICAMIRRDGIYYYCNLASPSVYDEEAIKNIDYDLDVKLYPDGGYQILDEDEYDQHAKAMHYPEEVKEIVEWQLEELIRAMERGDDPFNQESIDHYYKLYRHMLNDAAFEE